MPRKRKYDYQDDYPVHLFLKIPVRLKNDLDSLGFTNKNIDEIVTNYLFEFVENYKLNSKKD